MSTYDITETGGMRVGMTVGPAKGGYGTVQEALDSVKVAASEYGIGDEQLEILAKTSSGEYHPLNGRTPPEQGDFLVRVNYDYDIKATDVDAYTTYDVHWNALGTSLSGRALDYASMLDPSLIRIINSELDRAAAFDADMLTMGEDFVSHIAKVDSTHSHKIGAYLKEANENQLDFSVTDLKARGFDDADIKAVSSFRNYWDTHWYVKNFTDAKLLRNEGVQILSNPDTTLLGKVAKRGQLPTDDLVFDIVNNKNVKLTSEEVDKLIDGGELIRLRQSTQIDGEIVDFAFGRGMKPRDIIPGTDFITPYRKGYFSRQYKDPIFIEEVVKDARGKTSKRAIATARNSKDAELYVQRRVSTHIPREGTTVEHIIRNNIRTPEEYRRVTASLDTTMGRHNMRIRGKKLEDASAPVGSLEDSHLMSPEEAMLRSAKSVSANAMLGETFQVAKQRLLNTYSDVMPKKNGKPLYPETVDQIGLGKQGKASDVRSAKIMFEYLENMRNGYISTIDEASRAGLMYISEKLKVKGKGEEIARNIADKAKLGSYAKGGAWWSYIATNPLRQLSLGITQMTQLAMIHPKQAVTLAQTSLALKLIDGGIPLPKAFVKTTGYTEAELKFMNKEYKKSGLSAAISNNNLYRSALTDLATEKEWLRKGQSGMEKATSLVKAPFTLMKKLGFELSERAVLETAWVAEYGKMRSSKSALTATDLKEVAGRARNITYNMNRAGDMKYNHDITAVAFQFLQMPHKALTTITTNRGLSAMEKSSLALGNLLAFGLPASFVYEHGSRILSEVAPDLPDEHKEVVYEGLFTKALNVMLEDITGEPSRVSLKNTAPVDYELIYNLVPNAMSLNLLDLLADSPSVSAWGKIGGALSDSAKMFRGMEWSELSDGGVAKLAMSLAEVSSGGTNIVKALTALEYGKIYSKSGALRDESVPTPEAFAMAIGAQSIDEVNKWAIIASNKRSEEQKQKDINKLVEDLATDLKNQGITGDDWRFRWSVWGAAFKAQNLSPDDMKMVERAMFKYDVAAKGGDSVMGIILKNAGASDGMDKARAAIDMSNNPDGLKEFDAFMSVINSGKEE
jgi:hypothetical protein